MVFRERITVSLTLIAAKSSALIHLKLCPAVTNADLALSRCPCLTKDIVGIVGRNTETAIQERWTNDKVTTIVRQAISTLARCLRKRAFFR